MLGLRYTSTPARISILLLCLTSSACVVGRRQITLTAPASPTTAAATRGTISITKVTDERRFENRPSSPSTPSVSGDVNALSAEERAKMVGRQRGGYGNAMGDVALAGEDDILAQTRRLVAVALERRGYTVAEGAASGKTVEVDVTRFWSWMTPIFVAVRYNAEVACTLRINDGGATKTISVSGSGSNTGQVASNQNYELTFSRTYEQFLDELDAALEREGL